VLPETRRREIAEHLRACGAVTVAEVEARFDQAGTSTLLIDRSKLSVRGRA
jgi:hypothetical protein